MPVAKLYHREIVRAARPLMMNESRFSRDGLKLRKFCWQPRSYSSSKFGLKK
jgi:hypothetical protein